MMIQTYTPLYIQLLTQIQASTTWRFRAFWR
jgi:hypothetical protein